MNNLKISRHAWTARAAFTVLKAALPVYTPIWHQTSPVAQVDRKKPVAIAAGWTRTIVRNLA
jgi:hypothetical protein